MPDILLPGPAGARESFRLPEPPDWTLAQPGQKLARVALSAAHVVAVPGADIVPFRDSAIDIEATLRYRHYLWSLGLGVAEAMDTAQRGMGLDWNGAKTGIAETVGAARATSGAMVYSGIGTDHLGPGDHSLDDVMRAYDEQLDFVQKLGGRVIVMASRALVRAARSPEDYARVYDHVLGRLDRPAVLHWLGPMFDPALAGYWGSGNVDRAMDVCLRVMADHAARIEGIKVSLLDKDIEIAMRARLPAGVEMYTGDDFNYAELIAGDGHRYSHALLGIFDAIAPAASAALLALTEGDEGLFHTILGPTVPLSREIFAAPTQYYKTGVVFLAYLNGHQDHFIMLGAQQGGRSLPHLVRVFRLAAAAGVLRDPERAVARMRHVLALHGMES